VGAEAVSPGIKFLERATDHSSPFSAEVKNVWSFISTPSVCLHGVVFKHRDSFYYFVILPCFFMEIPDVFFDDDHFLPISHILLFTLIETLSQII
jgi:hypothetical protein